MTELSGKDVFLKIPLQMGSSLGSILCYIIFNSTTQSPHCAALANTR